MKKEGDHGTRCNTAHAAKTNKTQTLVKVKEEKSTKGLANCEERKHPKKDETGM